MELQFREPPRSLADALARGRVEFSDAFIRFEGQLEAANAAVAELAEGKLIPAALSTRACEPGDLAETLLDMGLDPFHRWNVHYFASNDRLANVLSTLTHDPASEGAYEEHLGLLLDQARKGWDNACARAEETRDFEHLLKVRDILRVQISQRTAKMEAAIYGDCRNHWRDWFGGI